MQAIRKAVPAALIILPCVLPWVFSGCKKAPEATSAQAKPAASETVAIDRAMLASFAVLPEVMSSDSNPVTEAKVTLGRMLYYDKRFSKNHDISCNSCHLLDKFGVDNKPLSPGHRGQLGVRNSPSSYNAAGHFVQFWDGRAADVEEQAKGPVLNPVEMAMPGDTAVVATLKSIPGYVSAFTAAFPGEKDPVTYENMAKAIGAFERKLVTPGRWDDFLAGNDAALTDAEKTGFNVFVQTGCTTCHIGPYLGGHIYQKAGLVKPWPNQKDQGRFEVTKDENDKMMFKVPSLRNIAETAPYFHDGSEPTLAGAVKTMALHQLGRTLEEKDIDAIVTWLKALTGKIPTDYIKEPELPQSGPKTPKPDPA